ncbi:MAG: DUF1800 family protein, partial [Pseudomonadota bacterium]
NHFNVDAREDVGRSVLPDYDRTVIRANMFGNFRVMLDQVVRHAAMMYYLDNRLNGIPNPNENYARELLELHTLGAVENYYGFVDPSQVPNNQDGEPAGYVEADVLETARLLTGFGVADDNNFPAGSPENNGEFIFRASRHDFNSKTILGQTIQGTGETELNVLLDYLCQHRGTAEYICWKLAVRFIGDGFTANSSRVQSAANIFQNNWDNPEQLTLVYRHLLDSSTFKQTWADKARRPLEIIYSALRAADVDYDFELNSTAANAGQYGYMGSIRDAGQPAFSCEPPTGYEEDRAIWKGTGPLVMSWRAVSRMLRDVDSAVGNDNYVNLAQQTNDNVGNLTPDAIANYWLNRVLGGQQNTSTEKRDVLVNFLRTYGEAAGNGSPLQVDTTNLDRYSEYQQLMRGFFMLVALLPERMIR